MTNTGRRGRERAATDQDIRRTARALLVEQGPEAVTLRAIARELGITAPALYRYYGSRDDLVEHLRADVVADLAAGLAEDIAQLPDEGALQLFAICKGFRRWALTHTKEFTLVFASPAGDDTLSRLDEPFGRIFLAAAGRVLAMHDLVTPSNDVVPAELRDDLTSFQEELLAVLKESGATFPLEKLDLGVTYLMIQFWARLYGHVTLEVFGNYPIPFSKPDVLFDAMLADLAREIGLSTE
ncbi:TetR family transcriptional regulator [Amycolatopsis sp. MJM2582]|uniref:TetR family transcriptional regulator n=1 Tax=Amycolatopsis japonica TaxID=208439 RepID=A0A075V4C0_9PSEU|nr:MULTISPECIES: TetR/AcrR family transcriptional regulator [Amycolatopsis]AIG81197.1 TetR family transcriptional regulator [Amycolatopsis japonica]KFZ83550.1 TetR family transcriptional regulator [Amycolatopsis sp. MJM2582]OKJ98462.1 TetR family transcriptional regulator [Amycolatopsis sp. CB00013]RSN49108.1 TetR/AcrR family transcriptional regulator [Amycolatopsis sp. WAC 04197]